MSKNHYFRTRFCKQRVCRLETLLKSARHNYYRVVPRIWDKLSREKSVLVISEILGLFVNTLTAEYKYCRRNMENFPQQRETQLFRKGKAFSRFLIAFLKCTSSLKDFEQKDERSSLSTPENIESK